MFRRFGQLTERPLRDVSTVVVNRKVYVEKPRSGRPKKGTFVPD